MKKFCTPRNLKLLSYIFVIIYCIKISLHISNPIMIFSRFFAITIVYVLFFIIDLDIIKKNIYKNTITSIIAAVVFALIAFCIDPEGIYWWLAIGQGLVIVQCVLFVIKRYFSIRLVFERIGQFFLFSIIQDICWKVAINIPFDINLMIYDGVEIMVLSVIGFTYFWTVDTFVKPNKN